MNVAVEIAVSLKDFNNFWRTFKMPLIDCKINLILAWSANCVISKVNRITTFKIRDTIFSVPVLTLSTNDYAKPLRHNSNQVLKKQLSGMNINQK